jgi:hypothetical protein
MKRSMSEVAPTRWRVCSVQLGMKMVDRKR